MTSQIPQLRQHFDGLNTAQKKEFIDKLKQNTQGTNKPEYINFLNECVQKYNASVRGGSVSGASMVSHPTKAPTSQEDSLFNELMQQSRTIAGARGQVFLLVAGILSVASGLFGIYQSFFSFLHAFRWGDVLPLVFATITLALSVNVLIAGIRSIKAQNKLDDKSLNFVNVHIYIGFLIHICLTLMLAIEAPLVAAAVLVILIPITFPISALFLILMLVGISKNKSERLSTTFKSLLKPFKKK